MSRSRQRGLATGRGWTAAFALTLALVASDARGQEPASKEGTRPEEIEVISEEEFAELTEEALPSEQQEEEEEKKEEEREPVREEVGPPPREEIDPAAIRVTWDQGFRIERKDKRFRLKIGGRYMFDQAWIHVDRKMEEAGFDRDYDYENRRAWVDVTGVFAGRFIYKAQVDVAGNSEGADERNRYLREVYIGWTVPGSLNGVRIGSSQEPFAMGELESSLSALFMESPLPMAFAPSYNPGILFNGQPLDRRVSWWAGAFRYSGDSGSRDRLDLTGRFVTFPFSTDEDHILLHVGASYSHQFRDDFSVRYRRRPEAHLADRYVDTGKFSSDGADLFALELAGKWGAAFFQSELVGSHINRPRATDVDFWGAYIQLGYLLTGEERPYVRRTATFGRVRLKTHFDWAAGTWGAFELGARFSHVDLNDEDIRGGTLSDVTLGLNWYVLPHVRLMANYVRAHLNGVGDSSIYQLRFQIDY